jgi:hypothetical protein
MYPKKPLKGVSMTKELSKHLGSYNGYNLKSVRLLIEQFIFEVLVQKDYKILRSDRFVNFG